jgi:hypothetical protein
LLPSAAATIAAKEKSNCPPPPQSTTVVCRHCHLLPPPSPPKKNPTVLRRRCQPPSSYVSTSAMWHPSKGVIHLEDDSSGNEIVDSDVDKVVQWDRSLSSTKTFKTAVLILSGRKFESPSLESLQKILHLFINEPTSDYFKKISSHATAFAKIQAACKAGWKLEATRKKKWSVHFTAEHLAFLLVLQKLVKKEKDVQDANKGTTCSSTGVPKANDLKRTFRKLKTA